MPSLTDKAYISFVSAVIFLLVSLPWTYSLTNKLGLKTLSGSGCPSLRGIFMHAAVFGLLTLALMFVPSFP